MLAILARSDVDALGCCLGLSVCLRLVSECLAFLDFYSVGQLALTGALWCDSVAVLLQVAQCSVFHLRANYETDADLQLASY